MNGQVGILNVGAGDTKLSFDPANPADCIRAARIVKDMLRRGYALLVRVPDHEPPVYRRAYDFDETTCEYIIADLDPFAAQAADRAEAIHEQESETAASPSTAPPDAQTPRSGRRTRRVAASVTHSVAVARSAGG